MLPDLCAAWAQVLPVIILRLPFSFFESLIWSVIVYWVCGLAPNAGRFFCFWFLLVSPSPFCNCVLNREAWYGSQGCSLACDLCSLRQQCAEPV